MCLVPTKPIRISRNTTDSTSSVTHHKQFLPRFGPLAQHLRALGDNRVGARRVLDVDVGAREQADGARLARTGAAQPGAALLEDLHRVADVQFETVRHVAVPVVDGCVWMAKRKVGE